ncbi:MAG: hypothetical protein LAO76_12810 [Acidobacteriia bacterium]|nr:hypothetical protein [Terriglobia bacterium]
MAISRRIFLGSSVATALACVSAPLAALAGGGRVLPRENDLPNRNSGSTGNIAQISAKIPETLEQRYGGIANISRNSFAGAIGSAFKLSSASGNTAPFWLTLLSVTELSAPAAMNPASMAVPPPAAARQAISTDAFNLAWFGGPIHNVQQGTFFVEHPHLGQFALFIVPAGPQQYTAIVNRLQTKTVLPV